MWAYGDKIENVWSAQSHYVGQMILGSKSILLYISDCCYLLMLYGKQYQDSSGPVFYLDKTTE